MEIPTFKTDKELFSWLKENEGDLIYHKKSQFKKADSFSCSVINATNKVSTTKSSEQDSEEIKVRAIINTTMIMDSHKDVHINGIWNKSLKENSRIKHLQEHQMKFDKIISDKDDLKAFVKTYDWRELGYDKDGQTEALVFDSTIKSNRNNFMFKEYSSGNVDNHSVGMYYVRIKLAFNSTEAEDAAYKEVWDKYIDSIVNKEDAEKNKYFYAILEAKAIEGSAVVNGSNPITPTMPTKAQPDTENELKIKAMKDWLSK